METPGRDAGHKLLKPVDLGIGLLFDAIRDAVVVSDSDGRIVLWNHGAQIIFGWTPDEAHGMNVEALVPPAYRAAHHEGMRRYAETGHGKLIDTHLPVELPALRKDGSEISIELTLAPLETHKGRFALAVMRDVTERVRLRLDLEKRNVDQERVNLALSRANDSLTAFTYVVSHDLKEPVRAIDMYLRLIEEDYADRLPEDGRDMLERARIATSRLSALLRGLLDLSRVDREELQLRPVTLRQVLDSDSCRVAYEELLHERKVVLDVSPGERVLAAPSVLCQVLGNLVLNAIRHNPSPEPRVRVTQAGATDPGMVEVHVEDNGSGFPDGFADRFNSGQAGTLKAGFGLLIARRAVERLGGRLWLGASAEMGGALVRFTLPRAP